MLLNPSAQACASAPQPNAQHGEWGRLTVQRLAGCVLGFALALSAYGLTHAADVAADVAAKPAANAVAQRIQTPYASPKVLFDFYLDDPAKMGTALYWVRSFMNPLIEPPYSLFNDDMQVKVLIHGTEIVTLARHNEAKYTEVVQRMRYYADQGVQFLVCGLALQDYGYTAADMQPFVTITPSAITELVHWQNRGFALVTPQVMEKRFAIESIR